MARPTDIKYAKTDEWARVEGDLVVVGITDYAVEQLGDLAFIDFPAVGAQVEQGSTFGEIESTKAAVELFAPVSGEVVAIHEDIVESLESVTDSPFEAGWLVKIKPSNPAQLNDLMSADEYDEHLKQREH